MEKPLQGGAVLENGPDEAKSNLSKACLSQQKPVLLLTKHIYSKNVWFKSFDKICITSEHSCSKSGQPEWKDRVKRWAIHKKIFHFLFGDSDNWATVNQIKQNIHMLKENQLRQQDQIKEQYKLMTLTRI